KQHSEPAAPLFRVQILQIGATHAHRPLIRVVETKQQFYERALPGPVLADERDQFAAAYAQTQSRESRLGSAGIRKCNVVELDTFGKSVRRGPRLDPRRPQRLDP